MPYNPRMADTVLLIVLVLLAAATLALLWKLWLKQSQAAADATAMTSELQQLAQRLGAQLDRQEKSFRDEAAQTRKEAADAAREGRTELAQTLKAVADSMTKQLTHAAELQGKQFDSFSQRLGHVSDANEKRLEAMRLTIENKLKQLQEDNARKLDEMRKTVDEKLHNTLEKRLGESFKQVSERLEKVHQGLGEMQSLASGVGDLKRIMTNVKTRGTWGEMQLDRLLEQVLTPEQYDKNVATVPGSAARVEFAIRLPGRDEAQSVVHLPIDAKFPTEDYDRLAAASEACDQDAMAAASKALESRIESFAKDIAEKYLSPPDTTDFGIMFLPTEALYAEVVRNAGLVDRVRQRHRVVITGPTTIAALLNSLQMGFRTLAIEKRSSEVWKTLAEVKREFEKFGDVLAKVKKQVGTVANTLEETEKRTRVMNRKLRVVEALPEPDESPESAGLLEEEV